MASQITVTVEAVAEDANGRYSGATSQPVTVKLELAPEADSHAEAIVRALRHGADVAAARLGCLSEISAPPVVGRVIEEMAGCINAGSPSSLRTVERWAQTLCAEYGMQLLPAKD